MGLIDDCGPLLAASHSKSATDEGALEWFPTLLPSSFQGGPIVVHNMEVRSADDTADRRWIVLGEDGKFVTLGRATSPSEAEISRVEDGLRAQGLTGWLAVMSGSPYSARSPTLLMVRPLAAPKGRFDAAARAFRAVRRRALTPHQSLKP